MVSQERSYGLDLVRCLAVCMVFGSHSFQIIFQRSIPYFWYLAPGGVELFFSLSGFLIGRILLDLFKKEQVSFSSITRFWTRRWLRTLPLYYVLYFLYLFVYNQFIRPVNFDWRYLVFLQNFFTGPRESFFGESSSLSVEEWFYLCTPLLVYALLLVIGRIRPSFKQHDRPFLTGVVLLIVGSLLLRIVVSDSSTTRFPSVVFRMDSIAYGLGGAYLSTRIKDMSNARALTVLAGGLICWAIAAMLRMDFSTGLLRAQLYYPLCGIGTTITVVGLYYYRFKKKYRIVPYISKISYSIYLTHLTGIILPLTWSIKDRGLATNIICWLSTLVIVFLVASCTYRFIERPFLLLRQQLFPRQRPGFASQKAEP